MDSVRPRSTLGDHDQHQCQAALQDEQPTGFARERIRHDADGQHCRYCCFPLFSVAPSLAVFTILCHGLCSIKSQGFWPTCLVLWLSDRIYHPLQLVIDNDQSRQAF
jgi:hypothetical protein